MNMHLDPASPRLFACILAAACCLPAIESISDETDKAAPAAADPMNGKEPGQVRDDNCLKMKLVWCPPGIVTMEQIEPDETLPLSARKITPVKAFLSRGYWIGKHEVTQAEWKRVIPTEPWKDKEFTKEGDEFPVTYVNWDDAMEFCRKLTRQERDAGRLPEGWEYALPTEAQWERACRARTETRFSFGDDISKLGDHAWFVENTDNVGEKYAHMVGQKKPNPWGLYDMHGNVQEWCRDFYVDKLPGGRDPEVAEPTKDSFHVVRGGLWILNNYWCRSGVRVPGPAPAHLARNQNLGFRVALTRIRQSDGESHSTDK